MHHLDKIHKHRALHVIGCAVKLHTFYVHRSWYDRLPDGTLPERTLRIQAPRFKSLGKSAVLPFQNGAELFRIASSATDQDVKMQQEISLDIAFDKPGVVQAQPVIPTLDELLTFTASTFDAFLPLFPNAE